MNIMDAIAKDIRRQEREEVRDADDFEDLDDIGTEPLPASDFWTLPLAEQDRLISQAQN